MVVVVRNGSGEWGVGKKFSRSLDMGVDLWGDPVRVECVVVVFVLFLL